MSYSQKAGCRFTIASWNETLVADIDGEGITAGDNYYPSRGLTRAEVSYGYTGDIEGTSTLTYLIAYHSGEAPVAGFERFEGSIGGQEGTCVLRHSCVQDSGAVHGRIEVVPGMGTGGLTGLRGEAELSIEGHGDEGYELVLAYDLD